MPAFSLGEFNLGNKQFPEAFVIPQGVENEPYLRSFQYSNPNCSFCHLTTETTEAPGEGEDSYKKVRGYSTYLLGVKRGFRLSVFSFERSRAGGFRVHFGALGRETG